MKISYNWVRDIAPVDWSAEEMAERLTLAGTACETVIDLSAGFTKMVVGKVETCAAIEKSDHLKHVTVSVGAEILNVICGAPNVAAGQLVAVALVGAVMPDGMEISRRKMFGIESEGMILSERELGLSDEHEGIIVLADNQEIGAPLSSVFGLNDYTLEFELTPNRPDSMCAIGIARDVAALSGCSILRPEISLNEAEEKTSDRIEVIIEDAEFCPRYAARIIRNVKIGPSPQWLRDRLVASGQTSINNVVDVTNYVMLEFGQPLHAFDLAHFNSGKVVVRRAKSKEKFTTLDEVERDADESVLMITNGSESLAAGGVMGGLKSSVTDTTKDILLEAAYFDPSLIRKSRRTLGLSTDSSARFERGVDPNITLTAINRAAQLLAEVAGGSPLSGVVDNYAAPIQPLTVELRPARCQKILGVKIERERIESILTGLELEVAKNVSAGFEDSLVVTVPTFRPDITREIDLIEEVARIQGFDNIPTTKGYLTATDNRKSEAVEKQDNLVVTLRETLLGAGFNEICGSGLADGRLLELIDPEEPQIEVANPISDEFGSMRNSLAYSLLNAARVNVTHQTVDLQLFELGNIYAPGVGAKDNVLSADHERPRLGALVTGQSQPDWRSGRSALDFYTLKGLLDTICAQARLAELVITPAKSAVFQRGQGFVLGDGSGKEIGRIGNVDSAVLKRFDIKQPVSLFELDVASLATLIRPEKNYQALSKFPAADRDLSLILDEATLVGEMLEGVEKTGGELVERVQVFDLFRGKQVPEGKKSVAISIRYRSAKKSLESSEVDGLQRKIIVYLKQEFKAEIREK